MKGTSEVAAGVVALLDPGSSECGSEGSAKMKL